MKDFETFNLEDYLQSLIYNTLKNFQGKVDTKELARLFCKEIDTSDLVERK